MAGEEVGVEEVGEESVEALRLIAGCGEGEVRAVAGAVAAVLGGGQREEAALDGAALERVEVDVIKALYSSLACVFAEAARRGASAGAVVAFLRGRCGVPEAQAGVVGEVFAGARERLREELARTGEHSSVCRLTGVDWRLEYRVERGERGGGEEDQDQEQDRERAPPRRDLLYHVVLKSAEDGAVDGKTAFVCSVEQMQDLVLTLKDACKAVERVVHQG